MAPLVRQFAAYLEDTAASTQLPRLRFLPEARNWTVQAFSSFVADSEIGSFDDISISRLQAWLHSFDPGEGAVSHALTIGLLHTLAGFFGRCVREGVIAKTPTPNLVVNIKIPDHLRSPIELRLERFYQEQSVLKGNTEDTIRWLKGVFPMFLRDTMVRQETDITKPLILDWFATGSAMRGWTNKTVSNYRQALCIFLDWCAENGGIAANPAADIPKPSVGKPVPRALTREQAHAVLTAVQGLPFCYLFEKARAEAMVATFLFTGVRFSELRNLDLTDVRLDSAKPELFVRKGKGKKDRHIPLVPELCQTLENYLAERNRIGRECEALFTGLRHDQRLGVKTIPRLMWRISERVGFHVTPHILRHTCVTLLLEAGCSTREMQELLGHASITTTERYTAITPSHLRQSVTRHPLAKELVPPPVADKMQGIMSANGQPVTSPEVVPVIREAMQMIEARLGGGGSPPSSTGSR